MPNWPHHWRQRTAVEPGVWARCSRLRKIALSCAAVSFLLLLLVAIDLSVRYGPALQALRRAQADATQADALLRGPGPRLDRAHLEQARTLLSDAADQLGSKSAIIESGWLGDLMIRVPWLGGQVEGLRDLRTAAAVTIDLGRQLLPIADAVLSNPPDGGSAVNPAGAGAPTLPRLVAALGHAGPGLDQAQRDIGLLRAALADLRRTTLIGPLSGPQDAIVQRGSTIADSAAPVISFLKALPAIMGGGTQHRYLLLLQNPAEERAGGGFIGAVGTVVIKDGAVVEETFRDSYFANGHVPTETAPKGLNDFLYLGKPMELDDAAWWPDFPTSADEVARFYREATGESVDGVIGVDPVALGYVLETLGPVTVPPYTQVITDKNALRELNDITNQVRPGDPGKSYLSSFGKVLFDKLTQVPLAEFASIAQGLQRGSHEKHIVARFKDAALTALAQLSGISGSLAPLPDGRDGILVTDSNISGTKGDLFVRRRYGLTLQQKGDQIDEALTLQYVNPTAATDEERKLQPSSGGAYRNYVRVYLRSDASVDGTTLTTGDDSQPAVVVDTGIDHGRRYVAVYLSVAPGSTTTLGLRYHVPVQTARSETWGVAWEKQIEALPSPADVTFVHPDGSATGCDFTLTSDTICMGD